MDVGPQCSPITFLYFCQDDTLILVIKNFTVEGESWVKIFNPTYGFVHI